MKLNLVEKGIIPSVNFHLWKACNYKCKFCFGTFNDVANENLKKEKAIRIITEIAAFGFQKITFSGGEPTLCPYLDELLKLAKELGLNTTIVTNGSHLDSQWLFKNQKNLDWIALSIDSINPITNMKSGRIRKNDKQAQSDENYYLNIISLIKSSKVKLKINTVISSFNKDENMNDFINKVSPNRWKIFQALPIEGQNEIYKNEFSISYNEFNKYLERHKFNPFIKESNYEMKGSYVMIDPRGSFFENITGKHKYSEEIYNVGIEKALESMNYSFKKFINRNGLYEW